MSDARQIVSKTPDRQLAGQLCNGWIVTGWDAVQSYSLKECYFVDLYNPMQGQHAEPA